jgi:hypothetical protein
VFSVKHALQLILNASITVMHACMHTWQPDPIAVCHVPCCMGIVQEADGLLPEEDQQVPGGYQDSLSSNTELGRAVRGACSELETLEGLVRCEASSPMACLTLGHATCPVGGRLGQRSPASS